MAWRLTPGQAADGPEGRWLIEAMGWPQEAGAVLLLMDSAYEGEAMRELAEQLGFVVVVAAQSAAQAALGAGQAALSATQRG